MFIWHRQKYAKRSQEAGVYKSFLSCSTLSWNILDSHCVSCFAVSLHWFLAGFFLARASRSTFSVFLEVACAQSSKNVIPNASDRFRIESGPNGVFDAQMRSRSTPVDPNAFPMCSDALSLDPRRSKRVSYVLKCALARRPSIQMRF